MIQAKFTDEEKERIKAEYEAGTSVNELASKYECSVSTIRRAISGYRIIGKSQSCTKTADLSDRRIDLYTAIARTAEIASVLNWEICVLTTEKCANNINVNVNAVINGENAPRTAKFTW